MKPVAGRVAVGKSADTSVRLVDLIGPIQDPEHWSTRDHGDEESPLARKKSPVWRLDARGDRHRDRSQKGMPHGSNFQGIDLYHPNNTES